MKITLNYNPKKYVTSQTLAPKDSTVVTREQLNQNVQNLWNQFYQNKYINILAHNKECEIHLEIQIPLK